MQDTSCLKGTATSAPVCLAGQKYYGPNAERIETLWQRYKKEKSRAVQNGIAAEILSQMKPAMLRHCRSPAVPPYLYQDAIGEWHRALAFAFSEGGYIASKKSSYTSFHNYTTSLARTYCARMVYKEINHNYHRKETPPAHHCASDENYGDTYLDTLVNKSATDIKNPFDEADNRVVVSQAIRIAVSCGEVDARAIEVFQRYYCGGFSMEEISCCMNINLQIVHRCIERCLRCIGRHLHDAK